MTIILIVLFICAWIYLAISWIRWARSQSKLTKNLKSKYPNIRRDFTWFDKEMSKSKIRTGAIVFGKLFITFGKLFISFGPKLHAREFANHFVDVGAIQETNDAELETLLEKMIRHIIVYTRSWLIGIIILVVLALTWWFK